MLVGIVERGWAGHFICAKYCAFRRNTLLFSGEKYIVVSTVGQMTYREGEEVRTIGLNRYYETMAFYSNEEDKEFHDIDPSREIPLHGKWSIGKPHADNEANLMHDSAVQEIHNRMIGGKL